MVIGKMPFAGSDSNVRQKVLTGTWDSSENLWKGYSSDALDFVRSLLVVYPSHRLTAQQALEHAFVVKHHVAYPALDTRVFKSLRGFARATALRRIGCLAMAWTLSPSERALVRQAFLKMDQTKSGKIAQWELRAALSETFNAGHEVVSIFKALNISGGDEISYSDFLASMCVSLIPLREDHIKEVFACFDPKGSGHVTRASFNQLATFSPKCCVVSDCVASLACDDAISEDGLRDLVQGIAVPVDFSGEIISL